MPIKNLNDLTTKELLVARREALVNIQRSTIKSDDKINMSIECWIKIGTMMYTTAELPYGDNGKVTFPPDYNYGRILKTRQGWENRGVAHGIIASHVPNDDTAFRTMEGTVIDVASDSFKTLIAEMQAFSRAEVLLAQQTLWTELYKIFDPSMIITITEAKAQLYATLSVTALQRETRNRIFADPTAIDEGINHAATRPAITLAEFNQKAGDILLWIEAEGILQGLEPGRALPSTYRRMKQALELSMLSLPIQNPLTGILQQRVNVSLSTRELLENQDPEILIQAYRLVYATAPQVAAGAPQAPPMVVMHVTDRSSRGRGRGQAGRGGHKGQTRGSPLELTSKARARKASPKDDVSPPKKQRFNIPLSERLDNSDQSLKALMDEVNSLRKQLAEVRSRGSALHASAEPDSESDEEYEAGPVKIKKGPASQKQGWTRVPNPGAFMASLVKEDDSDDVPELVDSSGEHNNAGKGKPTTGTASGSPAENRAAKAADNETKKGSPMEDLTNAPRRSGRTPIRVESYKPTSRSVNKAQSENDATGKPYVSKRQEGATTTRAGTEPEGARKSTTSATSQGEPVEVHYLVYVDDVVAERATSSSGTATPPILA